jgi:hypothetical protein
LKAQVRDEHAVDGTDRRTQQQAQRDGVPGGSQSVRDQDGDRDHVDEAQQRANGQVQATAAGEDRGHAGHRGEQQGDEEVRQSGEAGAGQQIGRDRDVRGRQEHRQESHPAQG